MAHDTSEHNDELSVTVALFCSLFRFSSFVSILDRSGGGWH